MFAGVIMKKTVFHLILLLSVAVLLSGAVQAQTGSLVPYQEGLHYVEIEGASAGNSDEQELVELFSYLCTHCYTFEPYMSSWKKRNENQVGFRRIPVVFGRAAWEIYARGYVTAQMMGLGDVAHSALMDKLWKEKAVMRSMEELADFYSQFGVTAESFLATSKSFAVDATMRKDQRQAQAYGVRGTPSLVLNGKYLIAGNAAVPSFEVMLDVVDFLIERESAARAESTALQSETENVVAEPSTEAQVARAAEG
jgi:thiol:disulfide interchange protein DsbA